MTRRGNCLLARFFRLARHRQQRWGKGRQRRNWREVHAGGASCDGEQEENAGKQRRQEDQEPAAWGET